MKLLAVALYVDPLVVFPERCSCAAMLTESFRMATVFHIDLHAYTVCPSGNVIGCIQIILCLHHSVMSPLATGGIAQLKSGAVNVMFASSHGLHG